MRTRCSVILVVFCALLSGGSAFGQPVLSETFTTDPAGSGWVPRSPGSPSWVDGPYTGPTWWTGGDGYITVATDSHMVQSPQFAVDAGAYYKVEFDSRGPSGPGNIELVGVNLAATYGKWTKPPSWTGDPNQLTPISTQFAGSASWTSNVEYFRVRPNAVNSFVRFQAKTAAESGNVNIDNVTVTKAASMAQVKSWADSVYAQIPPVQYAPTDPNRFTGLSRTMAKLQAGQPVTIVMLGDSIMDDTSNSTLDALLQGRYGSQVTIVPAVGSGTSMKDWNNESNWDPNLGYLNVQANVVDVQPDLVMMGGISNRTETGSLPCYDDFRELIDKIRTMVQNDHGYTVDIMLLTGVLSDYGDASGYLAGLEAIAAQKGTAVFDIRSAWNDYLADAAALGYDHQFFMRDSYLIHGNTFGKQAVGRLLDAHLAPEPATLALLAAGLVTLIRRRRR